MYYRDCFCQKIQLILILKIFDLLFSSTYLAGKNIKRIFFHLKQKVMTRHCAKSELCQKFVFLEKKQFNNALISQCSDLFWFYKVFLMYVKFGIFWQYFVLFIYRWSSRKAKIAVSQKIRARWSRPLDKQLYFWWG